ncbi:hypothetical protein [Paenibacillus silviterrae]|uniref:hypothetical protein n=1 Tax=Paenibacillus silviterrae TaxID=3242194 RepID=UPI002543B2B3|nr:hypothetical protein [Paenibacillus chinjuensis]
MQFFKYYLIYAFNWTLLLSLGLSVFRFNLKHYYYQIIVSALLLSYISANIQYFDKGFLTAIVQPICAILCLRLIFRIHWGFSTIIIGISYGINIAAEFSLTFLLSKFEHQTAISNLQSNNNWIIGLAITLFNLILCWALNKYRLGFSFITSQRNHPIILKGLTKHLFYITVFSLILIAISGFVNYFFEEFIVIKHIFMFIVFGIGIRIAYRKELIE